MTNMEYSHIKFRKTNFFRSVSIIILILIICLLASLSLAFIHSTISAKLSTLPSKTIQFKNMSINYLYGSKVGYIKSPYSINDDMLVIDFAALKDSSGKNSSRIHMTIHTIDKEDFSVDQFINNYKKQCAAGCDTINKTVNGVNITYHHSKVYGNYDELNIAVSDGESYYIIRTIVHNSTALSDRYLKELLESIRITYAKK